MFSIFDLLFALSLIEKRKKPQNSNLKISTKRREEIFPSCRKYLTWIFSGLSVYLSCSQDSGNDGKSCLRGFKCPAAVVSQFCVCGAGQNPALSYTATGGGEEMFPFLPLVFLAALFFKELLQPALFNSDVTM